MASSGSGGGGRSGGRSSVKPKAPKGGKKPKVKK